MKNNEQQILDEIKSMMISIRQQIELLDAKMAELQKITSPADSASDPIDLDISSFDVVEVDDDLPFDEPEAVTETQPVAEPVTEPEPVVEPEPIAEPEPEPVEMSEDVQDAGPTVELEEISEPVMVQMEEPVAEVLAEDVPEAIIDAMTEKQAWRTDMPGSPVKDVRLAISLHERVLFINHLFSEDPMLFQTTINRINASESLEQVVDYVKETFPQWNLESDLVYRFMMAVRRKIR